MKKLFLAFKEDPAWYSLLFFAFFSCVSMPLARIFLLVCTVCVASKFIKLRKWPHFSFPSKGWLVYFGFAILASVTIALFIKDPLLEPFKGLGKVNKLFWYIGIPLVAMLVDSRDRFVQLLRWFVIGGVVGAIIVFVTYTLNAWMMYAIPHSFHMEHEKYRQFVPITSQWLYHVTNFLGTYDDIWEEVRKYFRNRPDSFSSALILQGTMHESQRLMAAIPAAFFLIVDAYKQQLSRKQRFWRFFAMLLISLALVFTCKRGPLFSAVLVMVPTVLYAVWATRSKKMFACAILIMTVLISFVFVLPAARQRILELPEEFSVEKGGRYAMWTQIVPKIHEEHPFGIGFRALTDEKMRELCPTMEANKQSHVHSTPLQVFVEFGLAGVIIYLVWFAFAIVRGIAFGIRGAGLYAVIPLAILGGICAFSLVEYNLADSEIVLLYSIGMGLCDCAYLNARYGKKNT